MSVNRVLVTGRLASDPTLVASEGKAARCMMRLAVQRKRLNGTDRGAVFIDVTAFERTAQNCAKFLRKGSRVCIDGRLEHSEWTAKDGQRRSKHELVAQEVEFLDTPPQHPDQGGPGDENRHPTTDQPEHQQFAGDPGPDMPRITPQDLAALMGIRAKNLNTDRAAS